MGIDVEEGMGWKCRIFERNIIRRISVRFGEPILK